ncbi:MAG TPA: hypothetical protein VFS00_03770, partial [Polyangiaceae bacterium]|nr:hypothetical protein [Polyangiaceae bacterium]
MAAPTSISKHRAQPGRLRECEASASGPPSEPVASTVAPRLAPAPGDAFVPAPPAVFAGRKREVARVLRALGRVSMAVLYGVAGVGKSALGYACGAAWAGPVWHLQAEAGRPLPPLVRELFRRAALAPRAPDEGEDEGACGAALAAALDERGALLLLDDVDRLPPPAQDALLRALGERLRRGRVITTARTRVLAPGHYDRLELVVRGLDRASAKRLWQGLDALHGAKAGFESAYRVAKGCPASLRHAHAGHPPVDPYAELVASLDPDARLFAAALALA